MKKIISLVFLFCFAVSFAFAQSDLQAIAQVNVIRKEPITLGQLKKIVNEIEQYTNRQFNVNERKELLDRLAGQRLLMQLAEKDGIKVLDSEINEQFNLKLSQSVGYQITEAEYAKMIKKEKNQSLDEFLKASMGISVAEAKKMSKEEILLQKYVEVKKGSYIASASVPTDGAIRNQYEMNKDKFFRPDMMKLLVVGVQKKGNDSAEIEKISKLNDKAKKGSKNFADIQKNAEKDGYIAEVRYAIKSSTGAQMLGIQPEALMQMFQNSVNFVSDITDMPDNRQFYVIVEKYDAKILALSDVLDPSQPVTVYEQIKLLLGQQLRMLAYQQAMEIVIEENKTAENIVLLKSASELDKLLSW